MLDSALFAFSFLQVTTSLNDRPYTLIVDAGSTGTRMYLFFLREPGKAFDVQVIGKGPALSSFQDEPENSHTALAKLVRDASAVIPSQVHTTVPLMVYATAGMRFVEAGKARAIYNGLRSGLLENVYPFDPAAFEAKTISGREEGVYAFLAANYLSKHIDVNLGIRHRKLMGVLDLGGSSTQIAVPPAIESGSYLLDSLGETDMYVKSFLSLGMERMRQLTYDAVVEEAPAIMDAVSKIPNPCAFTGYSEVGQRWFGTGDAEQCQTRIRKVLKRETHKCKSNKKATVSHPCLPMKLPPSARIWVKDSKPRFFLISGFVFVADFARWWMQRPDVLPPASAKWDTDRQELLSALKANSTFISPTIRELKAAAAVLCTGPWSKMISMASNMSTKHKYTSEKKVPHRCFEMNYIISLLSVGYGFPDDVRAFHFIDEIAGKDVEWSLGAFLFSRSAKASSVNIVEQALETEASGRFALSSEGLWLSAPVALMILFGILVFLRRSCANTSSDCCFGEADLGKVA